MKFLKSDVKTLLNILRWCTSDAYPSVKVFTDGRYTYAMATDGYKLVKKELSHYYSIPDAVYLCRSQIRYVREALGNTSTRRAEVELQVYDTPTRELPNLNMVLGILAEPRAIDICLDAKLLMDIVRIHGYNARSPIRVSLGKDRTEAVQVEYRGDKCLLMPLRK